jgi:hypothetical protein
MMKGNKKRLAAALAGVGVLFTTLGVLGSPGDVQDLSAGAAAAAAAFQSDLAPYGKWMDLNGKTYWRPNEATMGRNWRPYANSGNWVYTDTGWTWNSRYEWGWAAFHYGRWTDDPLLGWVWQPGGLWAPAWVAWRGNGTYCGWAPLPPESEYKVGVGFMFRGRPVPADFDFGLGPDDYCFIGIADMCQPDYNTCQVPLAQVAEVYKQTTIVETAYVALSGQFINAGIAVDRVRAITHQEIKPLKVADAGSNRESGTHGNTLTLYRPKIELMGPMEKPVGAESVMDDLLGGGAAAHERVRTTAHTPVDVMDDLLNGGSAARKLVQNTAHTAVDVMDDLLGGGPAAHKPVQTTVHRPAKAMDDLLSSGAAARKTSRTNAPAPAEAADSLLTRAHDMPTTEVEPVQTNR